MILLQLSAGQGPLECNKAIGFAFKVIEQDCRALGIKLRLVESVQSPNAEGFKSVLLNLESTDQSAKRYAETWRGAMLWVCQSPYRPHHKRKNWFFSGEMFDVNEQSLNNEISFRACRSSGAGGQHVNTTDSAVQATHNQTGVSVRVESERSQHANKRLATALLFQKLEALKLEQMSQQERQRWQQHWTIQRGNPVKIFKGERFALVS